MKFNYDLSGITRRRRRGRSILKGLVEPRVGRREQGSGGEEEEERGGRNFRRWNGKWSVTAALEIQIRMPSRSTPFERSLRATSSKRARNIPRVFFFSRESTSVSCRSVIVRDTIKGNTMDFFFLRIRKAERGGTIRNARALIDSSWKIFFFSYRRRLRYNSCVARDECIFFFDFKIWYVK